MTLVLGTLTALTAAFVTELPLRGAADEAGGLAEVRPVRTPPAFRAFEQGRTGLAGSSPLAPRPACPEQDQPGGPTVLGPPIVLSLGELASAVQDTRPLSLAAADFDEDGVPDLVSGRAGASRGLVVLYRGNVDAIFPHVPEARQRRLDGTFLAAPFFPAARGVELLGRPDFLLSGDFDNDGHADVLAAARGRSALEFLAGDGRGRLAPVEVVPLPGEVTALAAGEINRIDGLADLVVGVEGAEGPAVLVFEGPAGAVRSTPEVVALKAAAERVILAPRRAAGLSDLRIVAGGEPWFVEGRDRRLSSTVEGRRAVAPPQLRPGVFQLEPEETAGTASLSMRLNEDGLPDRVVVEQGKEPVVVPTAIEATIWVDSAEDNATAGDGSCTLREAILNANADGDTTGGDCEAGAGADLIAFDIAGGGAVSLIAVLSELPVVTSPATLDGNTQGCPTAPCIELDGAAVPSAWGLRLAGGASVVRGFSIRRFAAPDARGISVESDGNFIEGNFVGTDAAGTLDLGNFYGVRVVDGDNNTIGGTTSAAMNLVSGNDGAGVQIRTEPSLVTGSTSTGNVIAGNVMGTNKAITAGIPNLVALEFSASSGNTCGGTVAGSRNVISGNTQGLSAFAGSTANLIQGNFIGTNATGTAGLGNAEDGCFIRESGGNTFGGTAAGAGNVISDNGARGIQIQGQGGSVIQGNRIGTNAAGSAPLGNAGQGILLVQSPDNLIGGSVAAARNVLSANFQGLALYQPGTTGNVISGNYIGTDATGMLDRGNLETGIYLFPGPQDTLIGGTSPGAGNLVSGNGFGIVCEEADGTQLLGNFVGTKAGGMAPLGNTDSGIVIADSNNCTIGGTTPGARNVLSGNGGTGLFIYSDLFAPAGGHVVQGNYIGTDAAGVGAIANLFHGITLEDTTNTLIGGSTPEARNIVSGNVNYGVRVINPKAELNRVVGNYIGPNANGEALGNFGGVTVRANAHENWIGGTAPGEGNVISSNFVVGIDVNNADHGNAIVGNLIGLDPTGTSAMGNGDLGVNVEDTPSATVGGTTPGTRNVISANVWGVRVGLGSQGSQIHGNFIGTNAAGTAALGNVTAGVLVEGPLVDVGGTAPGAGNLISGNLGAGVAFVIPTDTVQGNLIGTDVTGTEALGNGWGVLIQGPSGNTIGGTTPAARNVISGNVNEGIRIESHTNTVRGNWIGVGVTGKPLPNGSSGVAIAGGLLNTVGGTIEGAGNLIAFNVREGVEVTTGTRNAVLGNSIAGNGLLGIELGDSDGATPNDALDGDAGANNLQNYPVLSGAAATPAPSVTISGSLNSAASTLYRVEFYASPSCDGSGHGEGARFLGFQNVTTNGGGSVAFGPVLAQPVSHGEAITATSTDPQNNTSEFSTCLAASCSSLVVFGSTVFAANRDSLIWAGAQAVRFVRGPLSGVSTYATTEDGTLFGANSLDISGDGPTSGAGVYYLVRPLGCGSWQTEPGAEPARDAALP